MDSKQSEEEKEEDSFNLEDFPNELLVKIFRHLKRKDLLSLSRVSTKLREIAFDPKFWRKIRIDSAKHSVDYAKFLSGHCPLLHSLSFRSVDLSSYEDSPEMLHPFSACESLKILDMGHLQVNDAIAEFVARSFRHLTALIIPCADDLTSQGLTHLAKLGSLQKLSIDMVTQIHPPALRIIAENFPNLQWLDIRGFLYSDDEGTISIINSHKEKLKQLWINGSDRLTEPSYKKIAECEVLEDLFLYDALRLTDASLTSLKELKNLKILRLWHPDDVTKEGLLNFLGAQSKLRWLELVRVSKIDNECLTAITKNCPELRHLDIRWCPDLTEGGIAPILENSRKLTFLELYATNIPLSALLSIPEKLPALRTLNLWNAVHVTQSGILHELRELAPKLIVTHAYDDDFGADDWDVDYEDEFGVDYDNDFGVDYDFEVDYEDDLNQEEDFGVDHDFEVDYEDDLNQEDDFGVDHEVDDLNQEENFGVDHDFDADNVEDGFVVDYGNVDVDYVNDLDEPQGDGKLDEPQEDDLDDPQEDDLDDPQEDDLDDPQEDDLDDHLDEAQEDSLDESHENDLDESHGMMQENYFDVEYEDNFGVDHGNDFGVDYEEDFSVDYNFGVYYEDFDVEYD